MSVLAAQRLDGEPHACELAIALAVALRSSGVYPERAALLEQTWEYTLAIDDAELLAEVVIEG